MQGHAYLIDCLLWKFAINGYTLQKSRAKQNFEDLEEAIIKQKTYRKNQTMNSLLGISEKFENNK